MWLWTIDDAAIATCILILLFYTVTISPSDPIKGAMVGSPQIINCTASTVNGMESSLVIISWMRHGGSYEGGSGEGYGEVSSINDTRVIFSQTTFNGSNTYTSTLQFTYLKEGDEGNYICVVKILESSKSDSVEIKTLSSKYIYSVLV